MHAWRFTDSNALVKYEVVGLGYGYVSSCKLSGGGDLWLDSSAGMAVAFLEHLNSSIRLSVVFLFTLHDKKQDR